MRTKTLLAWLGKMMWFINEESFLYHFCFGHADLVVLNARFVFKYDINVRYLSGEICFEAVVFPLICA